MAIYLDQTWDRGNTSEEAEARALGIARRIRLVPDIGMLGFRGDFVVDNRSPGGAECLLTYLLGQMIEAVSHAAHSDMIKWPAPETNAISMCAIETPQ